MRAALFVFVVGCARSSVPVANQRTTNVEPLSAETRVTFEETSKPQRVEATPPADACTVIVQAMSVGEVFIDGVASGQTPQKSLRVTLGRHMVTVLSVDRSVKRTASIDCTGGKTFKITLQL